LLFALSAANKKFSVGLLVISRPVEGEMMTDSVSGERMVAFVTGKGGRRWFSGFNAYKKWGDIEAAFRTWAKNFRKRLDELHQS
jgi:hypothetical protein